MFMSGDLNERQIKLIAVRKLHAMGIEFKLRTTKTQPQSINPSKELFHIVLHKLTCQTVTTKSGYKVVVPKLFHEMCTFVLTQVKTEGIFRKEGSKSRQNKIKESLDKGQFLQDWEVIDVAVMVKVFLRNLPEPLIPRYYHGLFINAFLHGEKAEALGLSYLTLPLWNLHVLSYLMQILNEASQYSSSNKMNSYNLAVVVGPNIFPIYKKNPSPQELNTIFDLIKYMIENSKDIGIVPLDVLEQAASMPFEREKSRICNLLQSLCIICRNCGINN